MRNEYENPLNKRYASKEMSFVFSDDNRYTTWRKLWIALAESEKELGLNITDKQIDEMKKYVNDINYDVVSMREKEVRHDVMAHVYAYGCQAKSAVPILHLGATSCYVTDNTDIILMKQALTVVRNKVLYIMKKLSDFALRYKSLATLGYTHLQPAQPTTVGKRATLWLQDLMLDLERIDSVIGGLKLRGVKGTTGTQASFVTLFDGDDEKIDLLEEKIVEKMGFESALDVTGQTYTRKIDYFVLSALSGVAQSAYKFANDLRILQSFKEIEEPFEKNQIGSSAMAYKRNPMRCERICALARYVITLPENEAITSSTQWLERTLDDSANKRITVPQAFLALDGVLNLYANVAEGMVVYEQVIRKRLDAELPFMATETILMECVNRGGNRQELHEAIRRHSMEAGKAVKVEGKDNDLILRIKNDALFASIRDDIDGLLDVANFTGRAEIQTEKYVKDVVLPLLEKYDIPDFNYNIEV